MNDQGNTEHQHLGTHLSGIHTATEVDNTPKTVSPSTRETAIDTSTSSYGTGRVTRSKQRAAFDSPSLLPTASSSVSKAPKAANSRRSAKFSLPAAAQPAQGSSTGGKRKSRSQEDEEASTSAAKHDIYQAASSPNPPLPIVADRKGKKRAARSPTPPVTDPSPDSDRPSAKRPRRSTITDEGRYSLRSKGNEEAEDIESTPTGASVKVKGKGKAAGQGKKTTKDMPKKANPRPKRAGPSTPTERTKKGDSATKTLVDDPMDDDDAHWLNASRAARELLADENGEDEDMGESPHEDDDDEDEDHSDENIPSGAGQGNPGLSGGISDLARRARESGLHLDEATAAALFGGGFRAFGGMMSGLTNRFKRLKADLRSPNTVRRLAALKECSEVLLVSNEDTLGGTFSTSGFATEFIAILSGKPNTDSKADEHDAHRHNEGMDEDAQLAAALAMSTGDGFPPGFGDDDEQECQLVACRCLAHLLEALPGSGHTLVHLGAVPVLCSKLTQIEYIELAEQTLSTMEKISMECPAAIVREGGLGALLNYLPFFSTNVQRTAVTAAANCCRNISNEYYTQVRDVFPILRETLTQADQRLVEQATLAVVRTIEAYRHSAENLEGLLDVPTVVAVNSLLMPSGGSPLLSHSTYTHLLRALVTSARGSAKVAIAFLEAGMTNTIYQILTGVLPPSHDEDEQGAGEGGQGLAGGVADMAVLQNLAHRPKDQVEEALALLVELLPPLPRDGVFDPKGYSEKNLARIKKGLRPIQPERPSRRSSRVAEASATPGSTGTSTPVAVTTALPGTDLTPTLAIPPSSRDLTNKPKQDQEVLQETRMELFRSQPELLGKYIKAIIPVLVDVYAASVAMRVRTKVLTGLAKAIAFVEPDDLRKYLKAVPLASFLCAIIAANDHPSLVLNALMLVEILANKLADVYKVSFQREGVVFEIEALAAQELSTAKQTAIDNAHSVKLEPDTLGLPVAGSSSSAAAPSSAPINISEDIKPLLIGSGLPSLSSFLESTAGPSTPRKSTSHVDPVDANIIRARILVAKKIFEDQAGTDKNAASAVLDAVAGLVKRLCVVEASEGELRDTLRDLTKQFSSAHASLSSFELLKSGLVDGLLEYVDIDGTVSSTDRRGMLFDIFNDTSISNPSPLASLVKRLHESLGRMEDFEVETAFNGTSDSGRSSGLSRSLRIRLTAEEGQDVPKAASNLSITVQAIASLQSVHDHLRSRIVDGSLMGGSGLSSMFAAYASGMPAPRGGSGSATSRLLNAINAASGGGSLPTLGNAISSSAPSDSAQLNASRSGQSSSRPSEPQRRRSARLSGAGIPDPTATAEAAASTPVLSSSAPEPSILPAMPMNMDMDFEDDDEYSDDDYDAEVFEDEMDEDMSRPAEKVVNMSVAPDGSRVEAKTPEGTRIATPNQAATQQAAGPSGTATPRQGSYAGAVKAVPTDWHIEFSMNEKPVSLEETIYGAVHRNSNSNQSFLGAYGALPTFKWRKVDGPTPTSGQALDAPSPASVVSTMPAALDPHTPTSKILRLLRVVYNLSVEGREALGDASLDKNLFVNNKLTAKMTRQMEEIMIIASNCLPEWAVELPKHFSFLFPFETRYSFLQSTSFGYARLIQRTASSTQARGARGRDDISHLARIARQKVRIARSQLLESCAKVLELYGTNNGILEVEYFDEIGTGLGPTLEFYSIASKEFARRSINIWRDEDETKPGTYVFHPKGLYPAPAKPDEPSASVAGSRMSWYKTLGLFVGRALLDSRIIDVNLNTVFLKRILGKPVKKTVANLKVVDPTLARSLERLQVYLQTRKEIEALGLPPSARRNKLLSLTVNGAQLADLSLDFTLPGYDIELKPGGSRIDVDDSNLEEYLDRILDMTLGSGISPQVKAFQEGFSLIFPIEDMGIFSPEELGLLFGNADEDWSKETLEHAIKADHGYNLDSRTVQNLVEVMSGYDKEQRRQFLQFITGAPKLPIGGFRGLTPPFTVVRKPHEAPFRADDYLPSVMTCAQYLKLPDYSTKEVLHAQLLRAMSDGGGSFHLS